MIFVFHRDVKRLHNSIFYIGKFFLDGILFCKTTRNINSLFGFVGRLTDKVVN